MRKSIKAALKGKGRKIKDLTKSQVDDAVLSLKWHFSDSDIEKGKIDKFEKILKDLLENDQPSDPYQVYIPSLLILKEFLYQYTTSWIQRLQNNYSIYRYRNY